MTSTAEDRLASLLRSDELCGSYFFSGDAARLRDDAARELIDAALDPSTRDFNLSRFSGESADAEALAAALAMPPMMADRRVVALFDAQRLKPTARQVVLDAIERLPPGLVLVVTAEIPKGSRASFYRTLKQRSNTIEWGSPRESEVPGWLMARARTRYDFELQPEAAQALGAAIGADASLLDGELAKLAAVGEDMTLSLERVKELVPNLKRLDRWTWMDLVAARRYAQALKELEGVLAGERASGLVAGLVEHHLLIGAALEGGAAAVKKLLGETRRGYLAWKAQTYARQARAWNPPALRRALELLRRADRQIKTGGKDLPVLEELLLALRLVEGRT
jgi:DNA polymerase-3 subunit delta